MLFALWCWAITTWKLPHLRAVLFCSDALSSHPQGAIQQSDYATLASWTCSFHLCYCFCLTTGWSLTKPTKAIIVTEKTDSWLTKNRMYLPFLLHNDAFSFDPFILHCIRSKMMLKSHRGPPYFEPYGLESSRIGRALQKSCPFFTSTRSHSTK